MKKILCFMMTVFLLLSVVSCIPKNKVSLNIIFNTDNTSKGFGSLTYDKTFVNVKSLTTSFDKNYEFSANPDILINDLEVGKYSFTVRGYNSTTKKYIYIAEATQDLIIGKNKIALDAKFTEASLQLNLSGLQPGQSVDITFSSALSALEKKISMNTINQTIKIYPSVYEVSAILYDSSKTELKRINPVVIEPMPDESLTLNIFLVDPAEITLSGFTKPSIDEVKNIKAVSEGFGVKLTWDYSLTGTKFRIYRKTASERSFIRITELSEKTFLDNSVKPNTEYIYGINAINTSKESGITTASFKTPNLSGMTEITGGKFTIGNTRNDPSGGIDEKPIKEITLDSFYIKNKEVTYDEWDYYCVMKGLSKPSRPNNESGNNPVVLISWMEAMRYCNWLSEIEGLPVAYNFNSADFLDAAGKPTTDLSKVAGYRLPTEAEWEYAARGGEDLLYSGSNNYSEVAWTAENTNGDVNKRVPHQVGIKNANKYKLYDMSGNVWEWCLDWYDENYYKNIAAKNPFNYLGQNNRSIRGGSVNEASNISRVSKRNMKYAGDGGIYIGFRVVRTKIN